ncbi:MAG: T9SS type A sorting domain-containing protein [Chitinophagaceae bacterium]
MNRIFYLSFLLLTNSLIFAQSPGGVAGSVLWLKANAGVTSSSWTDFSGLTNNFTAGTGHEVAPAVNIFNFNAGVGFDGTNAYMTNIAPTGLPSGNSDRTIFVVAKANAPFMGYKWIFTYGTPGFPPGGGTFQTGNFDGGLANAFYGSPADITSPGFWDAANKVNGAMATYKLNGVDGVQYDRGVTINTLASAPALTATSVNAAIGALIDGTANEKWAGSIAEIVLFPSALSPADRNQVESYLALKYGFNLGTYDSLRDYTASDGATRYWTASTTWSHDVFGIGRDDGALLNQTKSNSINTGNGEGSGQSLKGNLILSTPTPFTNMQFLLLGNDSGLLSEQDVTTGPAEAVGSKRVMRNWQIQNTGGAPAVNLSYDMSGFVYTGGTTANNYRLMVDEDGDGDYTTGTVDFVRPVSIGVNITNSGNQLNFAGVVLNNNAVFTIITQASALLPATWQGFTVSVQKSKATLTWKTSDEINVDHYTAEYSTNGTSFVAFGTLAAKNSSGINTYTLAQENLPAGIRYYRIKRVDKDGKAELSTVKSVRAGGLTTIVLKGNPVTTGRLELNIDVPQNQDVVIRVVNTAGKILVQQNTSLSTGTNAITTNVSRIGAGTYILQVQMANGITNKKFIKL